MRIAVVNSAFPFGSTGKIVLSIAQEYSANNDEVLVAYGRGKPPHEYKNRCYKISSFFSVLLSGACARFFDNEGLNNYFSTKRFLRRLEQFQPDILWLHNIHGYFLNYKLLFRWIKRHENIKVKWTLHDCWAFTGHCAYFTFAGCEKWTDGCFECPQKRCYPKSIFMSSSKRNYLAKKESFCNVKNLELIVPSNWLADLLKRSFLRHYPVSVVHNRIDSTIFQHRESCFREKYNLSRKFIVLGVASIWEPRKGLQDFLALEKLLDPKKFQIVLVGKLNKRMISGTTILYIPRTSNAIGLAEIYSAADLLFNPTYEDNYPTVNLEAEACKCPVLTYDTGGSAETLTLKESVCLKTKNIMDVCEEIKTREIQHENSSN